MWVLLQMCRLSIQFFFLSLSCGGVKAKEDHQSCGVGAANDLWLQIVTRSLVIFN